MNGVTGGWAGSAEEFIKTWVRLVVRGGGGVLDRGGVAGGRRRREKGSEEGAGPVTCYEGCQVLAVDSRRTGATSHIWFLGELVKNHRRLMHSGGVLQHVVHMSVE